MKRKTFKLEIDLESAAMAENRVLGISDILEGLVQKLRSNCTESSYHFYQNLHDINGHAIGTYAIKDKVIPEPVKQKRRNRAVRSIY